jgi:hypothetical protein
MALGPGASSASAGALCASGLALGALRASCEALWCEQAAQATRGRTTKQADDLKRFMVFFSVFVTDT